MDASGAILLLENGFAHCRVAVGAHGGLIASLFFAGLAGSVGHCAVMCGPFVLGQVGARLEAVPAHGLSERHRLCGSLLLSYHVGRASTYAVLGALAAWFAGRFGALEGVRWLSVALLGVAAAGFLAAAGVRLGALRPGTRAPRWSAAVAAALAGLVRPLWGTAGPVGWRGYCVGLALGFLPCGLLYSALAAAAATRDPLAGAAGLLVFAAGTVPALVAVALAGHAAGRTWRAALTRVTPALMTANAGFLAWLAWRLAAF